MTGLGCAICHGQWETWKDFHPPQSIFWSQESWLLQLLSSYFQLRREKEGHFCHCTLLQKWWGIGVTKALSSSRSNCLPSSPFLLHLTDVGGGERECGQLACHFFLFGPSCKSQLDPNSKNGHGWFEGKEASRGGTSCLCHRPVLPLFHFP